MEEAKSPLLHVCRLLNAKGAEYLVVGAWAMILNSVVRATEDVDEALERFRTVLLESAAQHQP